MTDANTHDTQHGGGLMHVASARSLVTTFAALVVLTVLTTEAAKLDLGNLDLYIAMAIATVKATLVALFFMHLKYERPLHVIVFLSAFAFVGVFISFALMDSFQYHPDVQWKQAIPIPVESAEG